MIRTSFADRAAACATLLTDLPDHVVKGRITGVSGLVVDVAGLCGHTAMGDELHLPRRDGGEMPAEIVGFRGGLAQAMPFGDLHGVGPGHTVRVGRRHGTALPVSDAWCGRVVDPLGRPIDGRGALRPGRSLRTIRAAPPEATQRARLGEPLDLGIRALNCFATTRHGQRLGEFLEEDLGPAGLDRAVVLVATSDMPPLMRRQAGYAAMTIAEHFRDEGKSVLLLMDSVTRFCLALREIGLSAGEPPATRGYPPSVFAELPKLLERAGPGPVRDDRPPGFITGLFTVLVEGDDHNEPIADAVRGILDGHVILDRRIGEAGRYPAIDILRSLSRAAHGVLDADQRALVRHARAVLALHAEMADLLRLGAYRAGTDPRVDEAVALAPRLEALLAQERDERCSLPESFARLAQAMGGA
ncbi:MAG: flagellum-specific ATP synthase FliI [Rhodospirillales bacterium]|nr:flagellum-specific ATP synthase FliI [Rhodospirillales bacterium]